MIATLFSDIDIRKGASFSPCRTWRYALWRMWGSHNDGIVAFVGLNPSTADETEDDPTIRRCIGFARDWGFSGLYMVNLFAFRATEPKVMKAAADPIVPKNDEALAYYQHHCRLTVAAWGAHGDFMARAKNVLESVLTRGVVKCLGKTKDGHPRHPLYLSKNVALEDVR